MPDIPRPDQVPPLCIDLAKAVREGAYVAVGLVVLGFQQAQVRRHELVTQLEHMLRGAVGLD